MNDFAVLFQVQSYINVNLSSIPSPPSPSLSLSGTNSCSSRILIVSEYFIFKCKKIEITVSDKSNALVIYHIRYYHLGKSCF